MPGSGALQYDGRRKLINPNWSVGPDANPRWYDDFLGDTLSTDMWTTSADTGCTAAAINVAVGGEAKMLTDTTDDDRVDMGGAKIWKPSVGAVYAETRLKATTITTIGLNFGMIDASTEASQVLAFAISTATWTTTPADGVAWAFDTDATTDVWYGIGVATNTDTTAVVGAAPVAATYEKLGIYISTGGGATWFQNDQVVGSASAATTATTLLAPYIGLINRSGAAHDVFVDYVYVTQQLNR